jgi:hypothetical protein
MKIIIKNNLIFFLLPFCLLAGINLKAQAQVSPAMFEYPNNHLPWFTIESDHFLVHYQKGSGQSAQLTSKIAEDIYEPITSLYQYEPSKKVSIVLRDREDFSNGAAYFFDDKIEIWVPALDTPLRGTHSWLTNVITHEFTHIVQLGASMKRTQRIPSIYLQWLSYEDVRRPDVLYGFPDGIVTMPFATVSIPAWFAEGTAQYQRSDLTYDYWDSHRDMILRTRMLSNSALNLTEMGFFTSKSSLERELVYNQGFDFTIYLIEQFGEEVIAELTLKSAETGNNNFDKVLEKVTGISADELYGDWLEIRKQFYKDQIHEIEPTSSTVVEESGFFNFYPQFSVDENYFAYLTNRGRDFARTALMIIKDNSKIVIDDVGGADRLDSEQNYLISHGFASNPSIDFISNRFSFSNDNQRIAYSRASKNRYGETYQDIYIFDIENEERTQITESARIQDPAWHPAKNQLAAVQLTDGTQNLVLMDIESGKIEQITNFRSGETVHTPVWADNNKIYFAMSSSGNRDIFLADLSTDRIQPVLSHPLVDFRDPWVKHESNELYFSSDISGIFNIYRKNINGRNIEQATNVIGGAFMPHVKNDLLYFSDYQSDGYKISKSSVSDNIKPVRNPHEWDSYLYPAEIDHEYSAHTDHLLPEEELLELKASAQDSENGAAFTLIDDERYWRPYSETTTGLSIFPVIRFDNYSKLYGSNSRLLRDGQVGNLSQNLWRDVKAGAYFSSRDVTESFSIFGGALLGPGSISADGIGDFFSPSRLNNLDRDLFLIVDYRGLPFIRRSWSPTISVEIYNLKRNVRDGLTIEEFACTSCLPEERSIDIRYDMWEANLFFRSKLNRWSLLELGAAYSPYRVNIESFYSEEFKQFIPGESSEYFRGTTLSASYYVDLTLPTRHSDIAPQGMTSSFSYKFQPGRLLQDYEISDGILSPVYSRDYNHSFELRNRLGFLLTDQTSGLLTTRAFLYLNRPEDYFYQDYTGGFSGMRSYPYFALGGQRTWFTRASLLRPVFTGINRQAGAYTFDKVFGHLFFEAGNGWGGPLNIGDNIKTGVGAELRFSFNSYYLFPMKFFVNTTYGFNRLNVTLPSQFITTTDDNKIQYGRELLFYFGLTFDFDVL